MNKFKKILKCVKKWLDYLMEALVRSESVK